MASTEIGGLSGSIITTRDQLHEVFKRYAQSYRDDGTVALPNWVTRVHGACPAPVFHPACDWCLAVGGDAVLERAAAVISTAELVTSLSLFGNDFDIPTTTRKLQAVRTLIGWEGHAK